jgi:hypothetical protein
MPKEDTTMTKRLLIVILLTCLALAVVATSAFAQNKKIGTATATELLIPVGARDLAMGGSSIATTKGAEAMYWNPAGMGRMKHSAEGMFSSMTYIADIGVNYGAVAGSFGEFGAIGFSVKTLSFGDIPLTTEDDPENTSGKFFSPAFVTVGISYSRPLTDAVSVGATVKIVSEQIDRVSASGMAFDFGVLYNGLIGIQGFDLGVAVKNIGPQMKFDGTGLYRTATSSDGRRPEQKYKSDAASFELPSVVEIGLAYEAKMGDNMIGSLNGSFTNNSLYLDEYRVGGEFGITLESLQLFGRAGLGMVPQAEEKENIFGATFGAGITYAATGITITLDYAYRQVEFFDANNVFSVKLGF